MLDTWFRQNVLALINLTEAQIKLDPNGAAAVSQYTVDETHEPL
jgi:hypothetical protein